MIDPRRLPKQMRPLRKTPQWYHVYMIFLDNHGIKTHFGHTQEYYTGITANIGRRLGDYILGRGLGYVNTTWRSATKTPCYVEYFYGTEWEAMQRERQIKHYTPSKKKQLIASEKNCLKGYKPLKHVVLRKNGKEGGDIIIDIQ